MTAETLTASETLGRYRLLSKLGQGGMGAVYLAHDPRLDRRVALKVLPPDVAPDAAAPARFRREAQALARLAHPGIVQVHDADEDGGRLFLVMEHAEGEDLARRVRRAGPLPPAEAADCARQAALALHHAHQRGLIHRDVKPSNLLLTPDGRVKLLDLGLARFLHGHLEAADARQETRPEADGADAGRTWTGAYLGTPAFAAPEQFRDARAADARTDVYALGCTLYFLLTGRPPFAASSVTELARAHAEDEPTPPEAPAGLAEVVRRMLAKGQADRYPDAAAVADALAPFAAPAPPGPPPRPQAAAPDSLVSTVPLPRRRRAPLVAAAVLLAVLAAVLLWLRRAPSEAGGAPPHAPGEAVKAGVAIDEPAPEIAGEDLDGRPFKLSDYRGKVVLLAFWADWCGYCRMCYPHHKELALKMAGKPFVLLGVNGDDDGAKARRALQRAGLDLRSWFDGADRAVAGRWGVNLFPTFVLIDHKGVVREWSTGYSEAELKALELLAERRVRHAEQEQAADRRR
jgi:thiol-disulfide isomerase/thioredoxin